jgi:hypothetical protein
MTTTEELAPLDAIDLDGTDRPLNPVEVEAGIRKIARLIHYGIKLVSDAEFDFRKKDAEHDRVRAHSYIAHDGPAHEKKYAAEIDPEVIRARDARDVAEFGLPPRRTPPACPDRATQRPPVDRRLGAGDVPLRVRGRPMTAPRTLPAVVLQSLPSCCVVCDGSEQVQCQPIGEPESVAIPCPHCVALDGLWTLIEVAW